MNKSRGRPRGHPATKARIAAAARGLFLDRGYRATTIRAVAAAADVDSALISYHFGSKQGLFAQAMDLRCGRSLAVDVALRGDPAGVADRLLLAVLAAWEDGPPPGPDAFVDGSVMEVLREFLDQELIVRLAEFLGGDRATERATAAVTLIGGLIFTRYLNPIGAMARLTVDEVRRIHAPALRAALAQGPRRRPASVSPLGRPVPVR